MKRVLFTVLLAILLAPGTTYAENVYRWLDSEGKVHFGRTLPPEYADKPYQILNQSGIVIERVDDPMAKAKVEQPEVKNKDKALSPLFTENEVRLRSDNLLMLKYQSIEDIEEAMELEVSQLEYDARLIGQTQASTMQAMIGQVSSAANRQRAGLKPDPEVEKTIRALRQRLQNSKHSLEELKERELKIRATFNQDIERYRFLQNGGTPGQMPEQTEPAGTDS